MDLYKYIRMMRPKHYLKNFLIFLPLVFSGNFFIESYLLSTILSFITFSMVASFVYIVNDLKDRDFDKLHETKKHRPIASGRVSARAAIFTCVFLMLSAVVIQLFTNFSLVSYGLLASYVIINLLYSFGLKHVPIVDVTILSLGFLIRLFYGGDSVGIDISQWLYLSVLAFSFALSLGKRRNELKRSGSQTRRVNKFYNQDFLDKNMYMCLCLTIIFYSLWAVDPLQPHKAIVWTIPIVMVTAMTYSLSIEKNDSDGDPINVLTRHKPLLVLVLSYGLLIMGVVYLF